MAGSFPRPPFHSVCAASGVVGVVSPHHKSMWPTKGERTGRGVGWQLSILAGLVGVAGGVTDECRLHFFFFF